MCGAYVLFHQTALLRKRFRILGAFDAADDESDPGLAAAHPGDAPAHNGYKLLPSEPITVVTRDPGISGGSLLGDARWGLVPYWADDPGIGRRMTNARSEGIAEKPAFRAALARRRCLIPADGFYEWQRETRRPMYFRRADEAVFAFAGLWEEWRDPNAPPDDPPLRTCAIITTEANGVVRQVHDRMPAILPTPDDEQAWLSSGSDTPLRPADAQRLAAALLRPLPDDLLTGYFVSKRVNARGEHGPEAIDPALADSEAGLAPPRAARAAAPDVSLSLPL